VWRDPHFSLGRESPQLEGAVGSVPGGGEWKQGSVLMECFSLTLGGGDMGRQEMLQESGQGVERGQPSVQRGGACWRWCHPTGLVWDCRMGEMPWHSLLTGDTPPGPSQSWTRA
jgi:hypothetical protein